MKNCLVWLKSLFNTQKELTVLREKNLFLSNLIKSLPGHVYWKDGNGVALGCNEQQARSAGLSIEEYIGKTDYQMPWKDQADLLRKVDLEVFYTGKSIEVDELSLLQSGDMKIFHSKKVPLYDNKGKSIGILGVSFDVTEHRSNEEKSHKDKFKVEQTLKELIAATPAHIFWYSLDGILLGCNATQAKAFGYKDPEEMIGTSIYAQTTQTKEDLKVITEVNSKIIEMGMPYTAEEPFKYPDGTEAIFFSKKVPLKDERGKITGILGVAIDITERKKMEENLRVAKEKAESANQAKEAFLCNMRHDLRTPFSGILTLSEWMATQETDLSKKENLECIAQSAQVLLDYMNTVLEHAQKAAQTSTVVNEPLNLEKLIVNAMQSIQPMIRSKGLSLTINYPHELPKIVCSDASRLQRIVLNLLGNAVKFTHQGKIHIDIALVNRQAEKATFAISISDTGIGIPAEKHEVIFERFTRLEAAYEGHYSGMGLGLHDVKELCHQLDGKVKVTSNGSQGSIFTCTLPFELSDATVSSLPKMSYENQMPIYITQLNVLLIEDQPIAAHAAAAVMRSQGYEVDIAISGRLALEKFTSKKYDLILVDIGLPDMDGVTLTQQFKQLELANQQLHTPLIALTAHENAEEHALHTFDKVFSKPFSLAVLNEIQKIFSVHHKPDVIQKST